VELYLHSSIRLLGVVLSYEKLRDKFLVKGIIFDVATVSSRGLLGCDTV
jgi:hypothetical protein